MPRLIDVLSCLGLFIQIFVSHSILLLWVATNIFSRSFIIIPVMVLSSSFTKSLEAFKAFKAKVELQQGKRIKVVHYDKVVSNLVDMMRREATLDHLRGTFRNVALMLSL